MKCLQIILLFGVIAATLASNKDFYEQGLALRQRRDVDNNNMFANIRQLIQELAQNLGLAARQAMQAVGSFTTGIQGQAQQFNQRVVSDLQKLRDRVNQSIQNATEKISSSGQAAAAAIRDCIETHRQDADNLFNETLRNTASCADDRINNISSMVTDLTTNSNTAMANAQKSLEEMRDCINNNKGFLAAGACLGAVVFRTELGAATYFVQSGTLIVRINASIMSLPASLELCAAARLLEAGVGTARIVADMGTCSASSLMNISSNSTTAAAA